MRRWQLALIVLLVLVGASVLFWPEDEATSVSADAAQTAEATPAPVLPPAPKGARVSGFVMRDDRPVSRARVSLRSTSSIVALTLDDGRFMFDDLPGGPIYLSASTADAASEILGPFQLAPGGLVEDVQLILTPSVKVEGRVIDLLTQKPISGATIIAPTAVSTTDAQGRFSLSGAKSQTWLEVSAPGFITRTEWVSLELASSGGKLELVLTPSTRLEGTVTEGGVPVAAATIWAEETEGARRGDRSLNVFSDKEGKFSLECASGSMQLAAVTPRGTRVRGPLVRVSVGEKRTGLVLEAGDTASADGVVTKGGVPLGGAQISAIDPVTESVSGFGSTSFEGRFHIDGLALGKYLLQVRAGAFTAMAGPFDHVGDGRAWTVELKAGSTLKGRVVPASAGVSVRWRSGSWTGPSAQTVTDAEGRFSFEGLPGEFVSLDAEGPAGSATLRAKAGDEVVLTLEKGTVVVHLRDEAGNPVTDGIVAARSLETGSTRKELVLAPDGVTRMTLPAGRWELFLEVSGKGRSATQIVTAGPPGVSVTLTLEATVVVSGRVTARGTQLPISGAKVEASSGDVGRSSRVSVLTDVRGEFLLPPVPKSAVLYASYSGFRGAGRRAAEGPRWDVALELQPQGDRPQNELNQFEGVGMTLDARSGPVMVSVVSEGSPAERGGVLPGDQIMAIDGAAVAGQNLQQVVNRIRGPSGTPVQITFTRNGQTFDLTLRRRLLTL